ncbi:MAG: PEP-CTERM sorting domain-containing protein [Desulfococcaceae bacterium]
MSDIATIEDKFTNDEKRAEAYELLGRCFMKRFFLCCILASFCLGLPMVVSASSYPLTEVFLGAGDDDDYFALSESGQTEGSGTRAEFSFNLAEFGGEAWLYNGDSMMEGRFFPSVDEAGYDPMLFSDLSAHLQFYFSDTEADRLNEETISIDMVLKSSGEEWLFNQTSYLNPENPTIIDFDLTGLLVDGSMFSLMIAPSFGNANTDFFLDRVMFIAESAEQNPVPEPATILLFGSGLLSLGIAGRKRIRTS